MCEYQRINHNSKCALPMCDYTKKLCTYCVCGNFDIYKKAQKAQEEGISDENTERA